MNRADCDNMGACFDLLPPFPTDDPFPLCRWFMNMEANGMFDGVNAIQKKMDDQVHHIAMLQRGIEEHSSRAYQSFHKYREWLCSERDNAVKELCALAHEANRMGGFDMEKDHMTRWHKEHPTMPQQVYDCITARKYNTLIHLIEKGASSNTPADGKSCPLIEAVKNNDEYCVNVLLGTKGINVNSQDSAFSSEHRFWRGATALHYAAAHKSQTMVTRLLYAGADPTIKNAIGETPRDITPWKDTDYILEQWESLTQKKRDRKIDPKKYAKPRNLF